MVKCPKCGSDKFIYHSMASRSVRVREDGIVDYGCDEIEDWGDIEKVLCALCGYEASPSDWSEWSW